MHPFIIRIMSILAFLGCVACTYGSTLAVAIAVAVAVSSAPRVEVKLNIPVDRSRSGSGHPRRSRAAELAPTAPLDRNQVGTERSGCFVDDMLCK